MALRGGGPGGALARRGLAPWNPCLAAVIAVGTSLLVWVFLVEPYVRDQSLSLVERVVSVAYPAATCC